jgi:hypothetical protein
MATLQEMSVDELVALNESLRAKAAEMRAHQKEINDELSFRKTVDALARVGGDSALLVRPEGIGTSEAMGVPGV